MTIHSRHATVTKVLTGIHGFDEITDGGLPRGRTTVVIGGRGCGATVFALQSLVNGAHRKKKAGIVVAFHESARHIVAIAATFGSVATTASARTPSSPVHAHSSRWRTC